MELKRNDVVNYLGKTYVLSKEISISVVGDACPHIGFELLSFPFKTSLGVYVLEKDYENIVVLVRGL